MNDERRERASSSADEPWACACYNTRRAARLLGQAYDRALAPCGLKNTQFSVLASISGAEGALTITALADKLGMDRTTLTRNLDVLVRDGFVRVVAGTDARSKLVTLTASGRRVLSEALPLWRGVQHAVAERVDDWELLFAQIESLTEIARDVA